MLEIIVPAIEYWDEKNELFVPKTKEQTLRLEHSLVFQNGNQNGINHFFPRKTKQTKRSLIMLSV